MKYEKSFFETEIREGFEVDSSMKRNWAVQMDLLSWLCNVCEENGLRIYADFGTLLGAVRHKGFVPWDDDIDMSMLREDYEKLLKILPDYQNEVFFFRNRFHGEVFTPFLRITNSKKIVFQEDYLKRNHGWPFVAGIDVFPIDNIADDSQVEETREVIMNIIVKMMHLIQKGENVSEMICQIENLTGFHYDREGDIGAQSFELFEMLSSVFEQDETTDVGVVAFHIRKEAKYPRSAYDKTIYLDFENIKIPAPIGYEEVLCARYGDYMTPVKMSAGHDYPYYASQIKIVEERGIDWKAISMNYSE